MSAAARWISLSALVTLSPSARAEEQDVKQTCVAAHSDAQKLRLEAKLRQAREQLLVCARPECPAMANTDCTKWLGEVQEEMPSLVIVATDADGNDVSDVKVLFDGSIVAPELTGQPLLLDPGNHTLRFERVGSSPVERKLLLRVGERNRRVEVRFSAQGAGSSAPEISPQRPAEADTGVEADKPIPVASWVLGGIGVLGLASFAYFALDGESKVSDLEDCKPNCLHDDIQSAKTSFLIGDISLGVGVVALAGATYFYLTRGASDEQQPPHGARLWLDVSATGQGASGLLGGRF